MTRRRNKPNQGARPTAKGNWGPWYEGTLPPEAIAEYKKAGLEPEFIALNDVFQVNIRTQPCSDLGRKEDGTPIMLTHLSIKRLDRKPIDHDRWRILQRIKNDLVGDEAEAVELYPAESRMVDTSNQYHLWATPSGVDWPFGFNSGRLVMTPEEASQSGAKQRPFDKEVPS